MYDSILVPTDGSDGASVAVDHAIEQAANHDATLHALFVVDTDVVGAHTSEDFVREQLEGIGTNAVESVASQASEAGLSNVETDVVDGAAHEGILDYAEDNDIDMIVMGTRGRSGLDKYLLGSVTEKVLRLSDSAVLTVKRDE